MKILSVVTIALGLSTSFAQEVRLIVCTLINSKYEYEYEYDMSRVESSRVIVEIAHCCRFFFFRFLPSFLPSFLFACLLAPRRTTKTSAKRELSFHIVMACLVLMAILTSQLLAIRNVLARLVLTKTFPPAAAAVVAAALMAAAPCARPMFASQEPI